MVSVRFFIFIIGLAVVVSEDPYAIVYQWEGCEGLAEIVENGEATLRNFGQSAQLFGPWIFYTGGSFAFGVEYIFSTNSTCVNFSDDFGSAKSVRLVGTLSNPSETGITLYTTTVFRKNKIFVLADVDNLEENAGGIHSYAISGNSSWTFYGGKLFSGEAHCIHPFQLPNNEPTLVRDITNGQPPLDYNFVHSVRKGCHVKA